MRQQGLYWVKFKSDWTIGHWTDNNWSQILGYSDAQLLDNEFDDIDERRIERNPVITVKGDDLFAVITRYGNGGMTKEEIEEGCKQTIPLNPPKYISDNPYLCKPDES